MSTQKNETTHSIEIDATADAVFGIVEDVAQWPRTFDPTIHAERVSGDDEEETIRIWALANGEVKAWTSRRHIDRRGRRVIFRQTQSAPPVTDLGGEWIIEQAGTLTRVTLLHDFTVAGDVAADVEWVLSAINSNSIKELEALKATAELNLRNDALTDAFEDTVNIRADAKAVYRFLHDAQKWDQLLPHVDGVDLLNEEGGVQRLTLQTRALDGTVHTTESIRIALPDSIVYKQTKLPGILSAHTGRWTVEETPQGVSVTSWHHIALDHLKVRELLGPDANGEARQKVRESLSANSRATLNVAKEILEESRV